MYFVWILTLAIISGQLIKLPIGTGGGITLLDISVMVLCFLGLIRLKFPLKKPPQFFFGAIFFILVALFSLIVTPLHLTPIEYFTSLSYTIRFSIYLFLAWLIYSGAYPSPKGISNLRKKISSILITAGLGLAFLGVLQFIFIPDLRFLTNLGWDPHYFRTVSTFLDPNFAGAYFVLTLIILMLHSGPLSSLRKQGSINNWIPAGVYPVLRHGAGMTIVYFALLTTFSRSSYLMFLVSGLTLSFLIKSKKIFISTIILFIILLIGFQTYSQLVAQPRGIDREQSASFRVNTWEQGLTIFQKSPILGVGFNTYRYAIREYNLGNEQFIKSHGSSSNDSSLLFVASTTGIIGLIIYLVFLATLFKHSYPNNPVLIAGLGGLLIHSIFANSLFYPFILVWVLLKAVDTKT